MTSRERLVAAINHLQPDRVPIDLASTQVTGISIVAYHNLRRYLGLTDLPPIICDAIQQICTPHDDILKLFGIDTRGLWPVMNHTDFVDIEENGYLTHTDEWGFCYRRKMEQGLWYDLFQHPLSQETLSKEMIDAHPFPKGNELRRIRGLRQQALTFRDQGYAVVLKSVCAGLFEMMIRLRGMENAMLDLMLNPDNSGRVLDKILQHKLDYWQMALAELGDVVDVIAEGDDFGTQTSQLISIKTWREIIKPRQTMLIQTMKTLAPKAKVFFHSCGNIRDLLPEFIEMGIDIINPVHITATAMNPIQLKKDFGKDIVFWGGGIDTQGTLPKGTPSQIKKEVHHNIASLSGSGGFVFNTIHNIQADVPPENMVAMFEAVLEYRA